MRATKLKLSSLDSPRHEAVRILHREAQTRDFTDVFYVSKIAQAVSSLSKIQHLRTTPNKVGIYFLVLIIFTIDFNCLPLTHFVCSLRIIRLVAEFNILLHVTSFVTPSLTLPKIRLCSGLPLALNGTVLN